MSIQPPSLPTLTNLDSIARVNFHTTLTSSLLSTLSRGDFSPWGWLRFWNLDTVCAPPLRPGETCSCFSSGNNSSSWRDPSRAPGSPASAGFASESPQAARRRCDWCQRMFRWTCSRTMLPCSFPLQQTSRKLFRCVKSCISEVTRINWVMKRTSGVWWYD